jgi:hypothetical protein
MNASAVWTADHFPACGLGRTEPRAGGGPASFGAYPPWDGVSMCTGKSPPSEDKP